MKEKKRGVGFAIRQHKGELNTIMPSIGNMLSNKGIEYSSNSKHTEFIVPKCERESIHSMIHGGLDFPESFVNLAIKVKSADGKVYIRQSFI